MGGQFSNRNSLQIGSSTFIQTQLGHWDSWPSGKHIGVRSPGSLLGGIRNF